MDLKKIKPIALKEDMAVSELVKAMDESGVMGAGRIAKAALIAESMIKDKDCKVFFGFAGAMVPAGMKQIVVDMLKNEWIDVFVSTGANLTHDLVEAVGHAHWQGHHLIPDEELNKKGIDRIYDAFMKNEVYQTLEDFFMKHWETISNNGEKMSVTEFLWKLGSLLPQDSNSILRVCAEKKIPIFCPAISDSGIGLMVWGRLAGGKKIDVDVFLELKEMMQIAFETKKAAVWYCGGGVPKNYIQQAMQFSNDAAAYGIQITMDRPEPGGSSGAELREGISWGKLNKQAKFVDVICDTTIALPLIVGALKTRLKQD